MTRSSSLDCISLRRLIKMIGAPEMVMLESIQEWVQARKLMRRTTSITSKDIKLVQAFYIGMLGNTIQNGERPSGTLAQSVCMASQQQTRGMVRVAEVGISGRCSARQEQSRRSCEASRTVPSFVVCASMHHPRSAPSSHFASGKP